MRTPTIALERPDRHAPFFMGTDAAPEGIARHGRMSCDRAFDICVQSPASCLMSRSRSDAPIPVDDLFHETGLDT